MMKKVGTDYHWLVVTANHWGRSFESERKAKAVCRKAGATASEMKTYQVFLVDPSTKLTTRDYDLGYNQDDLAEGVAEPILVRQVRGGKEVAIE